MKNDVFITGTSCYFPNKPVSNEDMEDFLGLITGKHSRVKPVILKQNGIKQRYYALTKEQKITHTNAEMAVNPSTIKKFRHLKFRNRIVVMCNIQSGPNASLSCIHGTRPVKKQTFGDFLCIRHLFVMFTSI